MHNRSAVLNGMRLLAAMALISTSVAWDGCDPYDFCATKKGPEQQEDEKSALAGGSTAAMDDKQEESGNTDESTSIMSC